MDQAIRTVQLAFSVDPDRVAEACDVAGEYLSNDQRRDIVQALWYLNRIEDPGTADLSDLFRLARDVSVEVMDDLKSQATDAVVQTLSAEDGDEA